MDKNNEDAKYERRRLALAALVARLGYGGIAMVAEKIGKSPSYVSRMLYEPEKKGGKRIGEGSVDALDAAFPGWLAESGSLTPRQRALLALFDQLDDTGQREIQEAAEKIAETYALRRELSELKRKAG